MILILQVVQTPLCQLCTHRRHTPGGAVAAGVLPTKKPPPERGVKPPEVARDPAGSDLAGVELHHQQFVDFEGDPLALALADHLGDLLVLVEFEVGGDVGQAWEFQVGFSQFLALLALADGNHITGLALVAGDVHDAAVHGHVAVVHQLAGAGHGGTEAEAEADVVETVLEQFQQVGTRGTLLGPGFLDVANQLTFGDAVVEAKLLLLFEADGVFGALATGLAVLTGGIRPLCGLTGETGKVSQAPRNPQARAAVARHRKPRWLGKGAV